MGKQITGQGLRLAWAKVWRPAGLIAGLMIILSPRAGILGLATAGLGVAVWVGSATPRTRELGRYIAGFAVFAILRNLADDMTAKVYYAYVIDWERTLFGEVPSLSLQHRLLTPGHWGALDFAIVSVYLSYFLIPPTVLVLLWTWWPDRLRPYVTSTLLLFGASLVVHLLVPTAPPWLASDRGYLPPVHQVVRMVFGEYAPATYHYGAGLSGNAVAAMPSVHLAVTALIACALWTTRLRTIAILYVVAMGFTVVYGGEHYAVDGIAGIALGLVSWRVAGWRARPTEPSASGARGDMREAILDPTTRVLR